MNSSLAIATIIILGLLAVGIITCSKAEDLVKPVTITVYERDDCPWCEKFHAVLKEAKEKHPNLVIVFKNVKDKAVREEADKLGIEGVPAFSINGGKIHAGFVPLEELESLLHGR